MEKSGNFYFARTYTQNVIEKISEKKRYLSSDDEGEGQLKKKLKTNGGPWIRFDHFYMDEWDENFGKIDCFAKEKITGKTFDNLINETNSTKYLIAVCPEATEEKTTYSYYDAEALNEIYQGENNQFKSIKKVFFYSVDFFNIDKKNWSEKYQKRELEFEGEIELVADDKNARGKFMDSYLRALKGSPEAQLELYHFYRKGEGVKKDDKKAFEWIKKCSDQNYPNGLVALGYCYIEGIGIEKNPFKAKECYERAIEIGDLDSAYFNLGAWYETYEKNMENASLYYEKASERNNGAAAFRLANYYLYLAKYQNEKEKTKYFESLAFKYFKKAVELKVDRAYWFLAECYYVGLGVEKNLGEAFKYYSLSAEKTKSQESVEAIIKLAVYYEELAVESDKEEAIKLRKEALACYKKAVELGFYKACEPLAQYYFYGLAGETNLKEAFKYYKWDAKKNNSCTAYDMLGHFYEEGLGGIEVDDVKAYDCYEKAVGENNPRAIFKVACYDKEEAKGLEEEGKIEEAKALREKAFKGFKLAVELKYPDSYGHLADCYFYGFGTDIDYQEAFNNFLLFSQKKTNSSCHTLLGYTYTHLGYYYDEGIGGVEVNEELAFFYYSRGVRENDPVAFYKLAECYELGIGTPMNIQLAVKYYRRAYEENINRQEVLEKILLLTLNEKSLRHSYLSQ